MGARFETKGVGIRFSSEFEWVKTIDNKGNQTNIFAAGEPIIVELGFRINKEVRNLEFGVGVLDMPRLAGLFTESSPIHSSSVNEGSYCVRMKIDPNYLREGYYSLALNMFADGIRQDTLNDTLKFTVFSDKNHTDEGRQFTLWQPGPLSFGYKWERIEPV